MSTEGKVAGFFLLVIVFATGMGVGAQVGDRETTVRDNEVVSVSTPVTPYNPLVQCEEDEVWYPTEDFSPPHTAEDLKCVHPEDLVNP
jgi:hypothetical protein